VKNRGKDGRRFLPLLLGALTLAGVLLLFADDAAPQRFPAGSHAVLAGFALAAIAVAYVTFQFGRRDARIGSGGMVKAILLAAAFLFWAANQLWPNLPQAGLFNDAAIGLFVLDVFLAMAGWPAESSDGVFEGGCGCGGKRCCCGCTEVNATRRSSEA
jgi:hypothetical protein